MTLQEVETHYSIDDIMKYHIIIECKEELEYQQNKKLEAQMKRK